MQIEEIGHDNLQKDFAEFCKLILHFQLLNFHFKRHCDAYVVDFSPKGLKVQSFPICQQSMQIEEIGHDEQSCKNNLLNFAN